MFKGLMNGIDAIQSVVGAITPSVSAADASKEPRGYQPKMMAAEDGRWDSPQKKAPVSEPFGTNTDYDFGGPEALSTHPQGSLRMPTGDSTAPLSGRDGPPPSGALRPPVFVDNSFDHSAPPTSPLTYNAQGGHISHDSDLAQKNPYSSTYEPPATSPPVGYTPTPFGGAGITPTPMGGVRTADFCDDVSVRAGWVVGSVCEVFSGSQQKWFVCCVVQDDGSSVLTVQFEDGSDELKQKSLMRNDTNLAPFGSKTSSMGHSAPLPAAFTAVPSQTRAGQFSYIDSVTGVRYGNAELAWQVHFERTIFGAAAPPSQTVHGIKAGKVAAAAHATKGISQQPAPQYLPAHDRGTGCMSQDLMSPPRAQPMRISDLSPSAQPSLRPEPQTASPVVQMPDYVQMEVQSGAYQQTHVARSDRPIELPSFSTPGCASNQSAYLQAHQVENQYEVGLEPGRRPGASGQDMYEWNQDPFYEWRAGQGAPAHNPRAELHQNAVPSLQGPAPGGYGGPSAIPSQPPPRMVPAAQNNYVPHMGIAPVQQPARPPAAANVFGGQQQQQQQRPQAHSSGGPERLWTGPPPSLGH